MNLIPARLGAIKVLVIHPDVNRDAESCMSTRPSDSEMNLLLAMKNADC